MKRRALLLLALPACALAQTSRQQSVPIYRCGPDGRQISDRPCSADAAGSSVRFDEPSSSDREAARQRAARDAKEAQRLQQERERLERQPAPPPQRLSAPPAPAQPASQAKDLKLKSPAKKKSGRQSAQRKGSRKASP